MQCRSCSSRRDLFDYMVNLRYIKIWFNMQMLPGVQVKNSFFIRFCFCCCSTILWRGTVERGQIKCGCLTLTHQKKRVYKLSQLQAIRSWYAHFGKSSANLHFIHLCETLLLLFISRVIFFYSPTQLGNESQSVILKLHENFWAQYNCERNPMQRWVSWQQLKKILISHHINVSVHAHCAP